MADTKEMLDTAPNGIWRSTDDLAAAIDACLQCAQSCTTCADADLAESEIDEMRTCIATCIDCADLCGVTARLLSRPAHADQLTVQRLLQACVRACDRCAEECSRHAHHHRHCALCERHCETCARACRTLLEDSPSQGHQTPAGS